MSKAVMPFVLLLAVLLVFSAPAFGGNRAVLTKESPMCELAHIGGRSAASTLCAIRIAMCAIKDASHVMQNRLQPH